MTESPCGAGTKGSLLHAQRTHASWYLFTFIASPVYEIPFYKVKNIT